MEENEEQKAERKRKELQELAIGTHALETLTIDHRYHKAQWWTCHNDTWLIFCGTCHKVAWFAADVLQQQREIVEKIYASRHETVSHLWRKWRDLTHQQRDELLYVISATDTTAGAVAEELLRTMAAEDYR